MRNSYLTNRKISLHLRFICDSFRDSIYHFSTISLASFLVENKLRLIVLVILYKITSEINYQLVPLRYKVKLLDYREIALLMQVTSFPVA